MTTGGVDRNQSAATLHREDGSWPVAQTPALPAPWRHVDGR